MWFKCWSNFPANRGPEFNPQYYQKKKKIKKEKETIDSLNAVFIKYFSETELLLFISETELKACVRYKCSATCF
jgi:hypothetical protein